MADASEITIPQKDLSGSKLRCLMLTSMPRNHVARVLSSLVSSFDASVDEQRHRWLPGGFCNAAEPKLGECREFLTSEIREKLTSWWLVNRRGANTPNWDLVSSCTVEGMQGLILVEAKAHDRELKPEGKSEGDKRNHDQIGLAIGEANIALNMICPGWSMTRDSHYQLCNRFAWAWKVASFGTPVILIYLGFLRSDEMSRCGTPFSCHAEWRASLLEHSKTLVPPTGWENRLQTSGAPIWATIQSLDLQWQAGKLKA